MRASYNYHRSFEMGVLRIYILSTILTSPKSISEIEIRDSRRQIPKRLFSVMIAPKSTSRGMKFEIWGWRNIYQPVLESRKFQNLNFGASWSLRFCSDQYFRREHTLNPSCCTAKKKNTRTHQHGLSTQQTTPVIFTSYTSECRSRKNTPPQSSAP